MTSRTRILAALALAITIVIVTTIAAGHRDGTTGVATAAGTSLTTAAPESTTTAAPTTTTAAPVADPTTTEAPAPAPAPVATEAPPVSDVPTTAATEPATTVAPVPTTVRPRPTVAPTPAPPPAPVTTLPPPPPTLAPQAPISAADAFARAKSLEAASEAPPPDPAPGVSAPAAAPVAGDDPLASLNASDQRFLACVRNRESRGDYTVVNRSSGAGGAYQFLQTTWNNTVSHLGRDDLRGTRPNQAAPHDQDMVAVHLLAWYGRSPWGGAC